MKNIKSTNTIAIEVFTILKLVVVVFSSSNMYKTYFYFYNCIYTFSPVKIRIYEYANLNM